MSTHLSSETTRITETWRREKGRRGAVGEGGSFPRAALGEGRAEGPAHTHGQGQSQARPGSLKAEGGGV